MAFLTRTARSMLQANAAMSQRTRLFDPYPLVRLVNPLGPGTWLVSELYPDGDTLYGLADLGFGCPELGCFSLAKISALHLPFGRRIARDVRFFTRHRLSAWTEAARLLGSIDEATDFLSRLGIGIAPGCELPQLPTPDQE